MLSTLNRYWSRISGPERSACDSIAAPTAAVRRPGTQDAQAGTFRPGSTATSSAGLDGLSSSLNR
jgi:hypothetical protein